MGEYAPSQLAADLIEAYSSEHPYAGIVERASDDELAALGPRVVMALQLWAAADHELGQALGALIVTSPDELAPQDQADAGMLNYPDGND